ncbi:unnamed protein product [Onchocerca ochengi]|uniref:Uncharacterized protein n=1 Tax=Onchocerca ochengi TaxID=42157 RepID=A0A182E1E1_ONCOC|nr:unnamed protein product [Onchocerca ochengi]
MGSRQSQLLNRQQQQLGRRRQHLHFHHLLTKSASIYLQLSSTPFPMNKPIAIFKLLWVDLVRAPFTSAEFTSLKLTVTTGGKYFGGRFGYSISNTVLELL